MKSAVSILLLCLYITYALRSILPYVEYSFNYDYISQELCINLDDDLSACKGTCYLNNQIKLFVGEQDSKQGIPLESRVEVKNITHTLANKVEINWVAFLLEDKYFVPKCRLNYSIVLELSTPPPQRFS